MPKKIISAVVSKTTGECLGIFPMLVSDKFGDPYTHEVYRIIGTYHPGVDFTIEKISEEQITIVEATELALGNKEINTNMNKN